MKHAAAALLLAATLTFAAGQARAQQPGCAGGIAMLKHALPYIKDEALRAKVQQAVEDAESELSENDEAECMDAVREGIRLTKQVQG